MSQIEQKELYDLLWELDRSLLNASVEDYKISSGEAKEASRRNAAYFAVALSLLQLKDGANNRKLRTLMILNAGTYFDPAAKEKYQFEVPAFVDEDVKAELALIGCA